MCGVLFATAILLLLAFVALWFSIASPIQSFSPGEAARARFSRRLSDYGHYGFALGALLVVAAGAGALLACE